MEFLFVLVFVLAQVWLAVWERRRQDMIALEAFAEWVEFSLSVDRFCAATRQAGASFEELGAAIATVAKKLNRPRLRPMFRVMPPADLDEFYRQIKRMDAGKT